MVITRGGGSLEELWPFNDEDLARAIFEMKTPVVSAIGHETDFTIADFVADQRASTPTAAAEMIVPETNELLRYLEVLEQRLKSVFNGMLQQKMLTLDNLSGVFSIYHPRDIINQGHQQIDDIWQRFGRNLAYALKLKNSLLSGFEEKLEALNPLKIMSRGYVLVTNEKKEIINSINSLKREQEISVLFHDGEAACQVREIKKQLLIDEKRV